MRSSSRPTAPFSKSLDTRPTKRQPGDTNSDCSEHIGEIMSAQVNTAESDQGHEEGSDPESRRTQPPVTDRHCDEEREQSVEEGRTLPPPTASANASSLYHDLRTMRTSAAQVDAAPIKPMEPKKVAKRATCVNAGVACSGNHEATRSSRRRVPASRDMSSAMSPNHHPAARIMSIPTVSNPK